MSRLSTSDKLEQYRRNKQVEEAKEARKELFWNTITLQPLRRRIAPDLRAETEQSSKEEEEETECSETLPWTRLDWAIIFIKFLVWVCMQVRGLLTHWPSFTLSHHQVIFIKIEFGAVFFLVSAILLMTSNLGKRKAGEASAYSVFNENCEAIDGTLTAQQFEREIRHGPAAADNWRESSPHCCCDKPVICDSKH